MTLGYTQSYNGPQSLESRHQLYLAFNLLNMIYEKVFISEER